MLVGNLLLNCVRESGDHGPFNSWDRVPYVTTVRDGATPSVVPATREIAANFIIGTYSSQVAIDNDDGSAYYSTHDNLLAYASLEPGASWMSNSSRLHTRLPFCSIIFTYCGYPSLPLPHL